MDENIKKSKLSDRQNVKLFEEGYDCAKRDKKNKCPNPYPKDSEKYNAWNYGYSMCKIALCHQ